MRIEDAIKQTHFKSELHKAVLNILFTSGFITTNYGKALKPFGLTTQQFNILRILMGQFPNPAPVSLLTERMLDKMSNASRLVDKLVEKQLVLRTVNKLDRRQVDVMITDKGKSTLELANEAMNNASKEFENLNDDELKLLNSLLDKLRSGGSKIA